MADQQRSRRRARTLISVALALAIHLVLIAGLAVGIRVVQAPTETPPIEVTLTRLFDLQQKPAPKIAPPPPRRVAPQVGPAKAPAAAPYRSVAPPPVALPENGPIDPRLAAAEAVRGALQGVVRCAHPDDFEMTPAERSACARMNRQMAGPPPTVVVDPADHARHDPPVASHGMAAHVGPLSPRPGTDLGELPSGPVPRSH